MFHLNNGLPSRPLEGKVALVTGGGRGIGAGIALELGKRGADVAVNYAHSSASAQKVVKEIESVGSRAIAVQADITNLDEIQAMFKTVVEKLGKLDIVVSNSGREKFKSLQETTIEDFDDVFNLNTRGQFFVAKYAFDYIEHGGRIILMSSIAAGLGVAGHALYAGSKAAIEAFTRCLAVDFGVKKCTVNAIAPAGIRSDMWLEHSWRYAPGCKKGSSLEEIEAALANASPLQRCGYPQDIGRVAAFLASPDGEWINGESIITPKSNQ